MGLFAAHSFLNAPNQPLATRIGAAIFASAFTIIGGGLIFGSLYGYSRQKDQAARELANPSSPWLWRGDWAASRVESKNKSKALGWWVGAVLVNMLTLPASLGGISQGLKTQDPRYILPAGFELIGLIVLFGAIRATVRFERFGKTYLEMNSLPFYPGGHAVGTIHVQLGTDAVHGVDLKLSCIRRLVTGSGDNRSTQQVPLWEDSQNIPATLLSRGPLDTIIPVDFAIPADAFQTDHDNPSDQVQWMLKAKADLPGVDYSDEFELPVFRNPHSAAAPASSTPATGTRFGGFMQTATASAETSAEVAEPAQHRVIVKDLPDGLEFYFRAGRNPARAALVVGLAAGCTGLFYAMLQMQRRPPMFALIIVGLLAFILVMASVHSVLTSSRIVVGNGIVFWKHSILAIGQARQVQVSEVESVLPVTSIQQASSSGGTVYSLRLQTKTGKHYTLIDDIESRQEARWIVSQIEKRAGLRLNSRVQIDNGFYGPPPQPGSAPADLPGFSANGVGTIFASNHKWSHAVGALFFVVWLAFWISMMLQMSRRHHTSIVDGRPAAGARTASAPGFQRTDQIKRADLGEVLAWPPQQQAEELMARCVEHDAAALEAFTQALPNWLGHIQLSNHLTQLENQGRYSSDLRVRRAEADLELTLDGWSKTPHSVDLLMNLAKSDSVSRPRSLYLLGVLAGDGVESERAQSFVLDYARNSSDPATRQWATEGLRFVGTDEALDELFDIFSHDPSFAVRDRAGCNISDCGIFERRQRLRMVPRLIDLASDPHANPQMRNWCFLALREITDENLPPDAAVWQRWYTGNEAATRAKFKALDWWQVRGDS